MVVCVFSFFFVKISLVPDLCALSLSLLAGSPPVSVTFQGQATLLPSTLNVLRGALINVDVASPQNGEVFLSWSDGLPAAHAFLVPQSATANLGVSFGLPTTTGTGSVASTTPSATTAPPIRLPPGCLLRPTVPNLRYERVVITLQQDFNSTNCDTFMIGLYRDMQLSSSSQLFLVDVREGSFIATVDISDPNAQGIATNFVARVSRGTTNQFYCVVYGGVTTCYPDLPLWMLMGISEWKTKKKKPFSVFKPNSQFCCASLREFCSFCSSCPVFAEAAIIVRTTKPRRERLQ